jgi:hypothetical protein
MSRNSRSTEQLRAMADQHAGREVVPLVIFARLVGDDQRCA